jgi:hypothetical protein
VIAGAPTDVAAEAKANVSFAGICMISKQLARTHHHARSAETALQCMVLVKGRLNRIKRSTRGREPFNRRDRSAIGHHGQDRAGFHRMPADFDGAGAAL